MVLKKNFLNRIVVISLIIYIFMLLFFRFKDVHKVMQLKSGNFTKDSVKVVILDKTILSNKKILSDKDFIIVFKSLDGKVFKIDNAFQYWDSGNSGDTITIFYAKEFKPEYLP